MMELLRPYRKGDTLRSTLSGRQYTAVGDENDRGLIRVEDSEGLVIAVAAAHMVLLRRLRRPLADETRYRHLRWPRRAHVKAVPLP